ncbi:HAUS augmin-like complex subunit 7 isoform X2 [Sminthopsis crassicaudata]|uniref:HAUS augmin-like complex subunit 7 isoform X2 n=1 Tax=Sminthopsis crassicaudata TaxID=9301 RepID=UPI003D68DD49
MAERWEGLGDCDNNEEAAQATKKKWEEEWEDDDEDDEDDEDEESEEDAQLSQEALRVLDRLKDIDCPFLEGLYITGLRTIKQFLCRPSIYRLVILEWLFSRLYPSFEDSFATGLDSGAKEKITDLTRLGHELMLCGPDDQDLIKGSAGVKEQLYFFNQLLDLVTSLGPEYVTSFFSVEENVCSLVEDNEMLLNKFFTSHIHEEILDPTLSPLPLDIENSCGAKENLHRMPAPSRPSPPKPLGAKIKVEELSEKLNKLTEMLQAHKEEVLCRQEGTSRLFSPNPAGFPKKPSAHCGKISSQGSGTLGLTLSDFHQLVIAFIHVFEDELHEFCDHPTPNINPSPCVWETRGKTLVMRQLSFYYQKNNLYFLL